LKSPAARFPFFHRGAGYAFGAWLGKWLPRRVAQWAGSTISLLYAHLQPSRVGVVQRNLVLIKARTVTKEEARAVFREFGRTLGDYFHLAERPAATALGLISEHVGWEHFETVRQLGRGGLLLTPHLSFFALGHLAARASGSEFVAPTKPGTAPALTAWRAAYRARWGVQTVEIGSEDSFVFLDVARHLDAGRFVAALVDRPNSTKTYPVTFPGGATGFSGAILLLAMARGCPVLPVTTARLADGTYRVEAHEPFLPERGERGDSQAAISRYCQRLADVFAPVIDRHPSQWFHFVPLTAEASIEPRP